MTDVLFFILLFLVVVVARQVHHILSEIIQGGLVLETNVEEIDQAGACLLILFGRIGVVDNSSFVRSFVFFLL